MVREKKENGQLNLFDFSRTLSVDFCVVSPASNISTRDKNNIELGGRITNNFQCHTLDGSAHTPFTLKTQTGIEGSFFFKLFFFSSFSLLTLPGHVTFRLAFDLVRVS